MTQTDEHKPVRTPLSRRQQLWAINYLTHGNASRAALEAGYGARTRGCENVAKRIHEIFLETLEETGGTFDAVSPDDLFAELLRQMRKAKQEGTKARLLELSMRAKGMFTDKIQVEHSNAEDMLEKLRARSPEWAEMVEKQLGVTEH